MVNSKYAIFFITLLFNLSLQIYYFRPNPLTFVALKEAKESMMKSILIIEDDITFGMMLKTWLSKKGFEVSSVSNIARAQKHIEGQGADLILSDLRLPDHDGIDLLKWMNEKGIDIPLIIMTGYADIQSAVQAMKLGARDYVAKPVNPEELLKKMSEALQAKEAPTTHTAAKTSAKKVLPFRPETPPKPIMLIWKEKVMPPSNSIIM